MHGLRPCRLENRRSAGWLGIDGYHRPGEGFPESRIIVIRGDETIVLQPFTIAVFESPHSTGTAGEHKRKGTIKAPFHSPAHYDDYKEGGSYSFLIEIGGFRTLVHASANFRKGMYDGVRADVVFLGIGTLGKKPDRFVKDYWDEVVGKTEAQLVIPVHWDDFSIALDEKKPLRPASLADRGLQDGNENAPASVHGQGCHEVHASLPAGRPHGCGGTARRRPARAAVERAD